MNQAKKKKSSLKKMTGVWKTESREGDVYYKGTSTEGEKWVVMENKFKKYSSQPDYIIYKETTDEAEESIPEIVENPQTHYEPDNPDMADDNADYDLINCPPLYQFGF